MLRLVTPVMGGGGASCHATPFPRALPSPACTAMGLNLWPTGRGASALFSLRRMLAVRLGQGWRPTPTQGGGVTPPPPPPDPDSVGNNEIYQRKY